MASTTTETLYNVAVYKYSYTAKRDVFCGYVAENLTLEDAVKAYENMMDKITFDITFHTEPAGMTHYIPDYDIYTK